MLTGKFNNHKPKPKKYIVEAVGFQNNLKSGGFFVRNLSLFNTFNLMMSKFDVYRKERKLMSLEECIEQQSLQQNNTDIWRGNLART